VVAQAVDGVGTREEEVTGRPSGRCVPLMFDISRMTEPQTVTSKTMMVAKGEAQAQALEAQSRLMMIGCGHGFDR